jgi:uncharacterized BrkB/YihY/UPF0761 family membrane protein
MRIAWALVVRTLGMAWAWSRRSIGWAVALASAVAMFAAVSRVVPNTPLGLRDVWPSALLAGALFVALSQAFPLYFRVLGGGYAAYKTLGLFLVLMTWPYCLAIILVLGAELNAFLGGRPGAAATRGAAMRVLIAAPPSVGGAPSIGPGGRIGRRPAPDGQRHDEARPAALRELRVEPPAV